MKRKRFLLPLTLTLLVSVMTLSPIGLAQTQSNSQQATPSSPLISSVLNTVNGVWHSIVLWLTSDAPVRASGGRGGGHHIPTVHALSRPEKGS